MGRLPVCMCDARARGAHGVRGRAGCAGCGVYRIRTAAPHERHVRHAGQTRDNLNIALVCEVMFLVYPEHVQEFLVIWF